MLRFWRDDNGTVDEAFDVKGRVVRLYTGELVFVTNSEDVEKAIDLNPDGERRVKGLGLSLPRGYLDQENSEPLSFKDYLEAQWTGKTTFRVFDDERDAYYDCKLKEANEHFTGGASYIEGAEVRMKLTLWVGAYGTYSDLDDYDSVTPE